MKGKTQDSQTETRPDKGHGQEMAPRSPKVSSGLTKGSSEFYAFVNKNRNTHTQYPHTSEFLGR